MHCNYSQLPSSVHHIHWRLAHTMTRQQQQYFLLHQDLLTFVVALRYLPIGGLKEFNQVSVKLAYGDNSPAIQDARVAAVQSLSGTGSCRLMAEFMQRWMPGSKVFYLHVLLWGTPGGGGGGGIVWGELPEYHHTQPKHAC